MSSTISAEIYNNNTLTNYTVPVGKTLFFRAFTDTPNSVWSCFDFTATLLQGTTTYSNFSPVMVAAAGTVITASKSNNSGKIYINGVLDDSGVNTGWQTAGTLNLPRIRHTVEIDNDDNIYVIGGEATIGNSNGMEMLPSNSHNFITISSLNNNNVFDHGSVIDSTGIIYVIGGNAGPVRTKSISTFNTITKTWGSFPELPQANSIIQPVIDSLNRLYVFTDSQPIKYESGNWVNIPVSPNGYTGGGQILVYNNSIFLLGGIIPGGITTSGFIRYNINTNNWTILNQMSTARREHTSVVDSSGRIYAIGGRDNSGTTLSSVERFDPSTGNWTTLNSMSIARREHTSVVDSSGRIYVIGGEGTPQSRITVERFDPNNNTWEIMPNLLVPCTQHKSVISKNDTIYVIGGLNTLSNIQNTTVQKLKV